MIGRATSDLHLTPKTADHVFAALGEATPVRVAYPMLAVQDVAHESQVDTERRGQSDAAGRARRHRWNLTAMCPAERAA